jgi:hypothetical protein
MKDQLPDKKLALLASVPPTISLDMAAKWVRTGRPKTRFYPLVWLTRVGWRLPN